MNEEFTPDAQFTPDNPESPAQPFSQPDDAVPEISLNEPEISESVSGTEVTGEYVLPEAGDFAQVIPAEQAPESDTFFAHDAASFTEELSPVDTSDEAVTDIILETLALENQEGADGFQLSPEQTDLVLDDLITAVDTWEEQPNSESGEEPAWPVFDETEPQVAEPKEVKKERPVRKGRPKRKSGDGLLSIPHLLSAAIWLVIIVAIGVTLGRGIWVCAADVLAFGRESKEVTISITADDTMESIADKLHDAGLINIPDLFLLYANLTGVEEEHKITTGTFTLNTVYDYMALVSHMGPRATNRVVVEDVLIPEGFNCRQIFALLEEKGICKAADLEAYAASGELKEYWFLEDVPRGDKYCLEGFLFPDTYDFYENSTPKMALEKMLDGFRYRFSEELKAQIPVLNERLTEMMRKNGESEEFIAANQLTLRDVLTVASLIEEETANTDESYRIASVIYNRLFSWGNTPRYLNIDATVIYALGGKTDLNHEDMAVDNPYNTYTNTGLTPGPISNPGLASIQAALNFEDTSYYYYTLNYSTGEHQFSKTYEEHVKWVEKFNKEKNNG